MFTKWLSLLMWTLWSGYYAVVNFLHHFRCITLQLNHIVQIWASSWDHGTNYIGDERRLRRDCAFAQSRQSLRCSHTWSTEVDEWLNQKSRRPTGWLGMRVGRMSLQRTKSAIISWDGSFQDNYNFLGVWIHAFWIFTVRCASESFHNSALIL